MPSSKTCTYRFASRKRLFTLVALALNLALPANFLLISAPCKALSKDLKSDLNKIEIKFFDHTYDKEEDEIRIERIEKLVFGESKTGSDDARISALLATVPELNTTTQSSPSNPKDDKSESQTGSDSSNNDNSNASQSEDDSPPDPSTDYPRVDAIEQVILGKSFKDVSLGKRLDQLELKAFKNTSRDPDLSKRVANLEKYVEKHYHKSISSLVDPRNSLGYSSSGNPYSSDNTSAYQAPAYTTSAPSQESGAYGMYQPSPPAQTANPSERPPSLGAPVSVQLTWLENHVYGRSFPQKPLIDRVQELEKTVFPSDPPDTSSSLPMQVKVLVNAVELMHKTPQASSPQTSSQFPSWPPQGSQASNLNLDSNSSSNTDSFGGYASQNQMAANSQYQASQPYNQAAPAQGQYGQPQYSQQNTSAASASESNNANSAQKKQGHPLLKSLAKTLLTVGAVGAVAAGSYYASRAMGGGYGNGYGGYGNSYGGYGNRYGSGYGMNNSYGSGIHF